MKRFIQIITLSSALLTATGFAHAQANYWNLGGTYFNTVTGAVSSTPTNRTDLYADAFSVPGLCNTYYRVSWTNVHGTPPYNVLTITDISTNTTGHPFQSTGDQYSLVNDGYMHQGASVAVAPLASDGTRKIYSASDYDITSWTVQADGTISGPSTVYSFPTGGGYPFDSRNPAEVSSDGKYLLVANGNSVYTLELATGTLSTYAVPLSGGRITGYEYMTAWSSTPRLYLSYNDTWSNPSGTGGIGYYDIGGSVFNAITTPPSGKTMLGFGFTDIEQGKNGNLYLAYNTGSLYTAALNTAGTLYSLSSSGTWTAVSGVSITGGMYSNWAYAIQTQIDGEDYDASYYGTPVLNYANMNVLTLFTSPSSATNIVRCPGGELTLTGLMSGMIGSKTIKVTLGTISGGVFSATSSEYPYTIANSANTLDLTLSSINATVGSYVGAYKIEIIVAGPCGNQVSTTFYFTVQNATALVDFSFNAPGGVSVPSSGTPILGAASSGISNYVNTVSGTGAITNYTITLYDQIGSSLGTVTSATPMTGVYNFNSITSGYFITNYSSYIASNPTFNATYEINTATCGKFSKTASFQISSVSPWMRQIPIPTKTGEVRISPNPTKNQFTLEWYETEENKGTAMFYLTDMMGRTVARNAWHPETGNNTQTVNISNLPAGIYHYQFRSGVLEKTGSLTKQ